MDWGAMEIDHLRELALLARTSNFTKTARLLNLSQSALSTHVMKMEKEVGAQLVDRSHQSVTFTPTGRDLLETASGILEAYDAFLARAHDHARSMSGSFSVLLIAHVDTAARTMLSRIQAFRAEHPNVQVDIRESLEYNTVELIEKGAVGCGYYGLGIDTPAIGDAVRATPLAREEFVLWLDRSHPLVERGGITPNDLQGAVVPLWSGIPNDLDAVYQEFFGHFEVRVSYSDRYCTSREDFFLNRVRPDDVVLLTQGADNINAIKIRDDRTLVHFDPPVYATSFIAFPTDPHNEALEAFELFLAEHAGDE